MTYKYKDINDKCFTLNKLSYFEFKLLKYNNAIHYIINNLN